MSIKNFVRNNQFTVNYKRMWTYVKPIWLTAILSLLICVPIGAMDSLIAMFLQPYTDQVMVEKSMEVSFLIPIGIVAFTTLQGGLNFIAELLNTYVGGKLTMGLKRDLFAKLVNKEPAYFDKATSGDVLFRFNSDAELACSGLLSNLKSFITRICSSAALVAVLFYNSWQLAILAVVVMAVALAPLTKIRKLLTTLVMKNNVSISALNTAYNETFSGNRTITSYNLQENQVDKFNGILQTLFELGMKMCWRTDWISPFMHFVISIGLGGAVAFGNWLIITQTITPGNFVAFIAALLMLYTPLKGLNKTMTACQMSFLAIERAFEILDGIPAIRDRENAEDLPGVQNEIRFDNVDFEYVPGQPVLKHVDLHVKAGETIALVGNSGGGKTTIASLLPRFYDVKNGAITIDGKDIRDITLKSLRDNIAVVFQDNFLFGGTIRDNVLLGRPDATDEEVQKALECAYLTDFVKTLPNGLDTEIGERGVLLSGGQKQRVAIARAFLKNAPVVVLDEATSALDNQSEQIVQQAIDNLMKDKTVFVIAHRLSTIRNANRIAVVREGEIVELGSHEELMQIENGVYKHLYDMQFRPGETA